MCQEMKRSKRLLFYLPPASLPLSEDARRESICKITVFPEKNKVTTRKCAGLHRDAPGLSTSQAIADDGCSTEQPYIVIGR